MSSKIMRYHNAELIEHLAHQYVLGTQTMRVRKRITRLRMQHTALDQRINYWEAKFSPLNNDVPELMPKKIPGKLLNSNYSCSRNALKKL